MSDTILPGSNENQGRAANYGKIKDQIEAMLRQGFSYREIKETLRCSVGTIGYHAKRLHLRYVDSGKSAWRYDWEAAQRYHDEGHSVDECAQHFGFSLSSWSAAVKTGKIIPHYQQKHMLDDILVANRQVNGTDLKQRLVEAGLLDYKCRECSVSKWNGKPIVLQLDHINGDHNDNRIENLRLLCPNCHSQTETYGAKNKKSFKGPIKEHVTGTQKCIACHETKPLEDFYIRRDLRSGRQRKCRDCTLLYVRERRAQARKH